MYSIIFMLRVHSTTNRKRVSYIMEMISTNQTFRNRNPRAWYSGIIKIGTIFFILHPSPVKIFTPGHVPRLLNNPLDIIMNI